MILFYDTETNGLPDFRAPSDAPHQPHIVQFAALLVDPVTRRERAAVNVVVRPDGWNISGEMSAIHGITEEMATRCGIPEKLAVQMFRELRVQAGSEVAHNLAFDARIMRIAQMRHLNLDKETLKCEEGWTESFCTMAMATPIVNLPPTEKMLAAGFTKPKSPRLSECVKHFFNEELNGAHDSMTDVRACMRLYFYLLDSGLIATKDVS